MFSCKIFARFPINPLKIAKITSKIIRNDEALFLFSFSKNDANLMKKYVAHIFFYSKNKQTKKFKTNLIYLYVVADRAFKIDLHLPTEFFFSEFF